MEGRESLTTAALANLLFPYGPAYGPRGSAPCCVAAWMGGEFGGEWIQIYIRLSPFTVQLKLSQHC